MAAFALSLIFLQIWARKGTPISNAAISKYSAVKIRKAAHGILDKAGRVMENVAEAMNIKL
jgi:hypothetical protein